MERIGPLEPPYREDLAEELRKIMPAGLDPIRLFRTLAHNPRVLSRVRKGGLLDPGSISIREREIAILRTTALAGAEYEWGVHAAFFASAAELTQEQIEATVTGDVDAFAPRERMLLDMCDALHHDAELDDALWSSLSSQYEAAQLIELIALAGQYRTISYLVNALRIDLEPWAPRFSVASRSHEASQVGRSPV